MNITESLTDVWIIGLYKLFLNQNLYLRTLKLMRMQQTLQC